jgi:hypothetical protein
LYVNNFIFAVLLLITTFTHMNDYNIECFNCSGMGRIKYEVTPIVYFGAIRALPHFKVCPNCKGTGQVWDYEEEQRDIAWDEARIFELERAAHNIINY